MATYTPAQMAGSGVLSTQSFTSGSIVTITITDKPSREVGSAYFTISAPTQDPTLPLYFVGSTFVPTNVDDIVVDTAGNHWACVIPNDGGTSSLTWTTAVTIPTGGVYIQGTGGIGATISTPILYYDPSNPLSYPGTGTTINDLSGNGLNGTMSNITYTSPYFTYNGSSSQIAIADNALLEPGNGDWTMEVWFYASSTTVGTVILGKFDNGGGADDVSYSIRTSNTTLFAQIGDGTGDYVDSTNYTFSTDTWYQVVYVWKSGVSLETYINGSSIGSVSHSLTSILNSSNPLYLGRYNGGEYAQNFDGRIGITRLYNTSLSSSEVSQNFNADKSKYGL